MRALSNIFWLAMKELRSVLSDTLMVGLIIYSFTLAIYSEATAVSETVNNASVAIVDEDRSTLSRAISAALYPPYFQSPDLIAADQVDHAMDQNRYMFVIAIPPDFERDVREGRQPSVQINIDATAVGQASLGNGYIQNIVAKEVDRFRNRSDEAPEDLVEIVQRRAFNPNGTEKWFSAVVSLIEQLSMLTIILTGAALLREREHGTIEHLMVMPVTAFQIITSKVVANILIILIAFSLSMLVVVEGLLDVPIAGSRPLLVAGTTLYLVAAAAIGIFLGTAARTMAQFGLLVMMTIIPMTMLSGGMTPIESQPEAIRMLTLLLPSRHFTSFTQAVVFRGADVAIVWPQLLAVAALGALFFVASLALFRRSIAVSH